jgi:hypothetical protein
VATDTPAIFSQPPETRKEQYTNRNVTTSKNPVILSTTVASIFLILIK